MTKPQRATHHARRQFQSTPPCGGRHLWIGFLICREQFQSTPSVWRETLLQAPRNMKCVYFNPLPPCGGRQASVLTPVCRALFQSTPSVWRETFVAMFIPPVDFQFQSTPSVWRETLFHHQGRRVDSISIHSLRVEGDKKLFALDKCNLISIHSLRVEGDFAERISNDIKDISIHSLRVEGDLLPPLLFTS